MTLNNIKVDMCEKSYILSITINNTPPITYYNVDEIYEIIDHFMAHLDTNKMNEITFDSFYKWFQDNVDDKGSMYGYTYVYILYINYVQ